MNAGRLPSHLRQLVLKPTVFCLHKCPYCDLRQNYYGDILARERTAKAQRRAATRPGYMPLEMALHVIDEGAALGMESMQLSGGDPLLYPYLTEVIGAAARHDAVFVSMNSVGTGVTTERADRILDAGLNAWNFSVDTLDPGKYERLRGVRDALPTILAAIETVRGAAFDRPEFDINYMTVLTRYNYAELPSLVAHCLDSGVSSMYLMNVYGDEELRFVLTESQIAEFRTEIVPRMLAEIDGRDLPQIVKTNARVVMGTFFSSETTDADYARGVYWPDLETVNKVCNTPNHYALVESDGRVLPCCLIEVAHEGEIGRLSAERSLIEVLQGAEAEDFRRRRIPFCRKCSAPRHKTLGFVPRLCRQFND